LVSSEKIEVAKNQFARSQKSFKKTPLPGSEITQVLENNNNVEKILGPFSLSPISVLQEILCILREKLIAFSLIKEDVDSSLVTQMLWGHTTHIGRTLDL
jgi:hypothetical protein